MNEENEPLYTLLRKEHLLQLILAGHKETNPWSDLIMHDQ